jgi:hypothetical protein
MAVVKLGKELREEIIKRAKNIFKAKYDAAKKELEDSKLGDEVYNLVMQPYQHHVSQLPSEFFAKADEFQIEVDNVTVKFHLNGKKPWFRDQMPENRYTKLTTSYYNYHLTLKKDNPEFDDYLGKVRFFKEKSQIISENEKNFVGGITKVLDAYTTLAPALKALPALWDLLPDDTKDKHKEVVERKKTKAEDIDIDFGSIASTIIANKLGA